MMPSSIVWSSVGAFAYSGRRAPAYCGRSAPHWLRHRRAVRATPSRLCVFLVEVRTGDGGDRRLDHPDYDAGPPPQGSGEYERCFAGMLGVGVMDDYMRGFREGVLVPPAANRRLSQCRLDRGSRDGWGGGEAVIP